MKILVLGDLHIGASDNSYNTMNYQLSVLNEAIEYCTDNKINKIIQTGDMFDIRKSTNTHVLHQWKTKFFDKLKDLKIDLFCIVGNHDAYYRDTLTPNAIDEHLSDYDNIKIYNTATEVNFDGTDILFMPWICQYNEIQSLTNIDTTTAPILISHPEINGANMGGSLCTNGLKQSLFKKFNLTIAGHFHTKGEYPYNIHYVGTPYELSWIDCNTDKGFHILDTETKNLSFIKTDQKMYYRISYDENVQFDQSIDLKNKIVKVVIADRSDFDKYNNFISVIENKQCYNLKIVEPLMELDAEDSSLIFDGNLSTVSTEELITDYINEVYPEKSTKLNLLLQQIHKEARNDNI